MLVTDIAVSRQSYCPARGIHTANVSLTFSDRIVRLFCNVHAQDDLNETRSVLAFIKDALRQMGRMPEYRSGRDELMLCPNLNRKLAAIPEWRDTHEYKAMCDHPMSLEMYRVTDNRLAA